MRLTRGGSLTRRDEHGIRHKRGQGVNVLTEKDRYYFRFVYERNMLRTCQSFVAG